MLRTVLELALCMLGLLAVGAMLACLVQSGLEHLRGKKPEAPEVKCAQSGAELRRGVAMWNAPGRFRQEGRPRA